jgi:hypothetical protein
MNDQLEAETSTWHTQQSQQTDIYVSAGIRTRNTSTRAAEDPRRRLRGHREWPVYYKYRVIKNSLCTWWLKYRKLQVMFNMFCASRQTVIDTPNYVLEDTRFTLTPSVIPNSNYVIMLSDLNCLKYFWVFLYCNRQVYRDYFIILYKYVNSMLYSIQFCDNTQWIAGARNVKISF